MKKCLISIAIFLSIAIAFSEEIQIFVSPGGNDTWSGAMPDPNSAKTDGPLASLDNALELAKTAAQIERAPVTIVLRGGTYFLEKPFEILPDNSGSNEAPIIFKNYQDEKPIISGGMEINGWQEKENGLWVCDVSSLPLDTTIVREIFVNGERRFRARTPNNGFLRIAENPGLDPKAPYNTKANSFRYAPGDINPNWTNLNDIEIVVHHYWVDTHLPIQSIDPAQNMVYFDRYSRRKLTDDFDNRGAVYYVNNVLEGMDQPGEWYLSKSTKKLYYLAKTGEDLTTASVIIPRLLHVLLINGKPLKNDLVKYLKFKGISFQHATYNLPPNEAGDYQASVHVPGAIKLIGASNITFENCQIKNVGTYAIEFGDGCRNNTVKDCEIADVGAGGIRLNGGDAKSNMALRTGKNIITDNHLHHMGQIWHAGVGLLSQNADSNLYAHNNIHHLYYTGISVGWVWGYGPSVSKENIIEYNHIHHVGQGILSDMGGVYLLGTAPGTIVRNNLIHDVDSRGYGGWGLYTDEGSTGVVLENNVVYRTKSAGFHQHYGKNNVIRNNIFAFGREAQIQRTRNEAHLSFRFENNIIYYSGEKLIDKNWKENNYKFDNNIYFRTDGEVAFQNWSLEEWQHKGQDVHSMIADPLFVHPNTYDFSLEKNSPAFKLGFQPIDLTTIGPRSWPQEAEEIYYKSSADGTQQPALFYNSGSDRKKPLLVGLHTWSGNYLQSSSIPYVKWCIQKDWVFIHPNFRGPNKNPQATGSDLVVEDILSAVQYAKQNANVDEDRIYLLGTSGGGYTSLLMAGKTPSVWAAVSAWVPISNLADWYEDSVELGKKYANDILLSCGGKPGESKEIDREYFNRSPINFLQNAEDLPLDINAGIFDGHTGSVPIDHTLNAFNKVAAKEDRISAEHIKYFVEKAKVPQELVGEFNDPCYGEKNVLFRKSSGKARVNIFNGGHEGNPNAALLWLERHSK